MMALPSCVDPLTRDPLPCDPRVPSQPAGEMSCSRRSFSRYGTAEDFFTIYFHYDPGGFRYAPQRHESPPMLMPCLAPPNRPSPKPHPSYLGAACLMDRLFPANIFSSSSKVFNLDSGPLEIRLRTTQRRRPSPLSATGFHGRGPLPLHVARGSRDPL